MQLNAYFRPEEPPTTVCACVGGVVWGLPLFAAILLFDWARVLVSQGPEMPLWRCSSSSHRVSLKKSARKRTPTNTHTHTLSSKPQGNNKFAAMRNGNVCNGNRGNAALPPLQWQKSQLSFAIVARRMANKQSNWSTQIASRRKSGRYGGKTGNGKTPRNCHLKGEKESSNG